MKKRWMILGILFLLLPGLGYTTEAKTEAETAEKGLLDAYVDFYGTQFEEELEQPSFAEAFEALYPSFRPKEFLARVIAGELNLSISNLFEILIQVLLREVYNGVRWMALILALIILSAYLTNLKQGFGKEGVSSAAFYSCYVVIAGIASTAFYQGAICVEGAIEDIALFMRMIVPVVMTMLLASGGIVSAAVFEPVLLTTVEIAVVVIQTLFVPTVMIAAAMNIVNHLSDQFKTERMVQLLHQFVKWGLSIMLTVFVSVAGIQSIAASGADGLTIKLSKFATANLIPVVGGILAESVETVMNCSMLIKNAVGIMGFIFLVVLAGLPLIKIGAILILFRISAAVAEPIAEPKIIACLSQLANGISILFSMLAATTVMFIIVLTVVINAGSTVLLFGR